MRLLVWIFNYPATCYPAFFSRRSWTPGLCIQSGGSEMPEKRYTKVEEEILQILDKMDLDGDPAPRPPLRIVRQQPHKPRFVGLKRVLRQPWIPLAVSGTLAFLAVMFSGNSHTAAVLLSIASILAFFSPLVLRRSPGGTSPPSAYGTKLWRGRDISLEPPRQSSSTNRARNWIDRHRRGH